jgi:hypothetical protein
LELMTLPVAAAPRSQQGANIRWVGFGCFRGGEAAMVAAPVWCDCFFTQNP